MYRPAPDTPRWTTRRIKRVERGSVLKSDPWLPVILQQRHLLQAGFTDRFIGNLIDRLQAQGIYEESLIIVTADHGSSFRHGMPRRTAVARDPADIVPDPPYHEVSAANDRHN